MINTERASGKKDALSVFIFYLFANDYTENIEMEFYLSN